MSIESDLELAGKNYSACARTTRSKCANPAAPSARESELLIGFGIASDWVRRAAAVKPLEYTKKLMNRSSKSPAVTEMLRFTMAWSSLNALFARPEILRLLGTRTTGGELDLFKILLVSSTFPMTTAAASFEANLRTLLATPVVSAVPGYAPGTPMPTVQVLHEKFTPAPYRTKGVGKTINTAISTGNITSLDLATIIYAMRNWSVHGGLIGSSFRSVPGFNAFIRTILAAVAEIHHGVSKTLLTKV